MPGRPAAIEVRSRRRPVCSAVRRRGVSGFEAALWCMFKGNFQAAPVESNEPGSNDPLKVIQNWRHNGAQFSMIDRVFLQPQGFGGAGYILFFLGGDEAERLL